MTDLNIISKETLQQYLINYFVKTNKTIPSANDIKLINVEFSSIGEGAGCTSKLIRAKLFWNDHDQSLSSLPKSVVIKSVEVASMDRFYDTMPAGTDQSGTANLLTTVHNDECSVYQILELNRSTLIDIGFPVPICYGSTPISSTEKIGMIILEDLSDKGRLSGEYMHGMDLDSILKITESLASFHAWSLTMGIQNSWREKIPTFIQRRPVYELLLKLMPSVLVEVKAKYPDLFGDLDEQKIGDLFRYENYVRYMSPHENGNAQFPSVLLHGDFHPFNLLLANDNPQKLIGVLDWQGVHQGCGLEDLVRFLFHQLSTENRRKHIDQILRRYLEVFKSKAGSEEVQNLTFEQVKSWYESIYAALTITFIMYMKIVAANMANASTDPNTVPDALRDMFVHRMACCYEDAKKILGW